jgi:hypothetical protein
VIVFRVQNRKTYYVARANALEDNLRIYVVKDGNRTQLATAQVEKPKLKAWHTLEVSFVGTTFKATLDGKGSVEATDAYLARIEALDKKEVKLKGTLCCAKCSLKEAQKCTNAIKVKEDGKAAK